MDKAAKIIYKYHGREDSEVAKLEIREIALHVKLSKPQTLGEYIRGLWDYKQLFNSHSARWRTGMVRYPGSRCLSRHYLNFKNSTILNNTNL